ncbi:hypothetical protein [Pseudonocardia sp. MH-G8]|uniref:hypothetical protein n=1 Tax=Pseudonocardia sp. MH-G8 TaxID=1854588 RepID=UPI000BA18CB7|nr:hypothetical protein [Pseudonocardia sp. MH-G8]OZM76131.1 hypothetical protein CFP66_42655 [Pseudonocardia sp. MH-G8]
MGDRGYEGDSGYLAHLGAAARSERWDPGRGASEPRDTDHRDVGGWESEGWESGRWGGDQRGGDRWDIERRDPVPAQRGQAEDDATADVARRLQDRLDQQVRLLERLQADGVPGLAELQDGVRLMRRDTVSVLLLCGVEPATRESGPRRLGEVVAEAAASAEDPRLVEVRPGPAALVAPGAAAELVPVLAELVDHAAAVYPGAWLELVSRVDDDLAGRGATVDVVVEQAARHDPGAAGGRRTATAAEQLARSSRSGITLRHHSGTAAAGSGLVASVHCPPATITVEEPPPPPRRPSPAPPQLPAEITGVDLEPPYSTVTGGGGGLENANGAAFDAAFDAPFDAAPNGTANGVTNGIPTNGALTNGTSANGATNGTANGATNGTPGPTLSFDDAPSYSPSASSQIDELFGPLLDLPLEPIDDRYATPIFEAIASAWFKEGDDEGAAAGGLGSGPLDWETPQDDEWREAAARAARPEPAPTTSSGLPRRKPGDQLVPPPRTTESQNGDRAERVPDRVRERLSTYQRGLREGRHRSEGEMPEGEDW